MLQEVPKSFIVTVTRCFHIKMVRARTHWFTSKIPLYFVVTQHWDGRPGVWLHDRLRPKRRGPHQRLKRVLVLTLGTSTKHHKSPYTTTKPCTSYTLTSGLLTLHSSRWRTEWLTKVLAVLTKGLHLVCLLFEHLTILELFSFDSQEEEWRQIDFRQHSPHNWLGKSCVESNIFGTTLVPHTLL